MPSVYEFAFPPKNETGQQVAPGGINNSMSDAMIAEHELSDSRNYEPDETGSGVLVKRAGLTKTSSEMTATISSVYQGKNANYFTSGTTTRAFAGTSLDTGLTAGYPSWETFATYDIMVNGTDARQTSDGSSFAAVSGMPAGAKYIAAANNFLYYAGHNKGALGWFNAGTLTYSAVNGLTLTQDENDDITGLAKWKNGLLVTCAKSFEIVVGYENLNQQVAYYSKEEGCLSHRSILITPVGAFWWSKRGVCLVKSDGFGVDFPMQRKLQATLNGLNRAYDAYVHAAHDPLKKRVMFWLYSGASTTVNLRADYYYYLDSWYLHSGAGCNMAASGTATVSGTTDVYVGGYAASTYLYKQSGATDDGTAITAYLETKRYSNPTVTRRARVVTMTMNINTESTVTYGYYLDNATTATGTWNVTLAAGQSDTQIGLNRSCNKLKHRVYDASAYANKFYGIVETGRLQRSV